MKKIIIAAALSCGAWAPQPTGQTAREQQAQNVTIIRDDCGIPHVYGKTDADAVFGVI